MINKLVFAGDTFKIVQFTDTHLRFVNPINNDINVIKIINEILDIEKPDLVILTGDCINGDTLINKPDAIIVLNNLLQIFENKQVFWTMLLGNHDTLGALGISDFINNVHTYKYFVGTFDINPQSRITDQIISIYTPNDEIHTNLYLLYSGSDLPDQKWYNNHILASQYDGIDKVQCDYISNKLKDNIQSLIFFHIPLQEYVELWYKHKCNGNKGETIACQSINNGCFDILKNNHNVKGVFVGHDHVNNFDGILDGVHLYYGNVTGWSSDDNSSKNRFPRGGRVIILNKNTNDIISYNRNEDGIILQKEHTPGSIPDYFMYLVEKNKALEVILGSFVSLCTLPFAACYWGYRYNKYRKSIKLE